MQNVSGNFDIFQDAMVLIKSCGRSQLETRSVSFFENNVNMGFWDWESSNTGECEPTTNQRSWTTHRSNKGLSTSACKLYWNMLISRFRDCCRDVKSREIQNPYRKFKSKKERSYNNNNIYRICIDKYLNYLLILRVNSISYRLLRNNVNVFSNMRFTSSLP